MAKTPKSAASKEWTPARLQEAVKGGTNAERIEILKKAGIVDAKGKLVKGNWGDGPTRTPGLEDLRPPRGRRARI
jgi:hypothetical protein